MLNYSPLPNERMSYLAKGANSGGRDSKNYLILLKKFFVMGRVRQKKLDYWIFSSGLLFSENILSMLSRYMALRRALLVLGRLLNSSAKWTTFEKLNVSILHKYMFTN